MDLNKVKLWRNLSKYPTRYKYPLPECESQTDSVIMFNLYATDSVTNRSYRYVEMALDMWVKGRVKWT